MTNRNIGAGSKGVAPFSATATPPRLTKPPIPPPVYRPAVQPVRVSPAFRPAAVQPKMVIQLLQCGECFQHNSHLKTCSKYVAPAQKSSGKGTHKPGQNHDDGSGYQKSGSGGDRHQKGLTAQITNANQKNFYRTGKKT